MVGIGNIMNPLAGYVQAASGAIKTSPVPEEPRPEVVQEAPKAGENRPNTEGDVGTRINLGI